MKIEKLSNNKLKVIFSMKDLEKQNIDYQSFMSGSTKSENILANLLYIAKTELDFDTKNCNIEVETFEVTHGNFVITITKFEKTLKRLKTKRKQGDLEKNSCIYEFSNFDNYYEFIDFLKSNFIKIYDIVEKNSDLYHFSDKYILIIDGCGFSEYDTKIFNTTITEFATFKSNSKALILKIKELNEKCAFSKI